MSTRTISVISDCQTTGEYSIIFMMLGKPALTFDVGFSGIIDPVAPFCGEIQRNDRSNSVFLSWD